MKSTDDILTYGYDFNMGKYMTDGWTLLRKGMGNYIGFTIVFFIIVMTVSFIPFANMLVTPVEYVLIAGLFIFTRKLVNDESDFSQFFEGFNNFGQIILYVLVLLLFSIPAIALLFIYIIPFDLFSELSSGTGNPQYIAEEMMSTFDGISSSSLFLVLFVFFVYIMYLYVSYSLTLVILADRKMQFWQAMELSRKVVSQRFFSFLALYILLAILLSIVAIFTCGLGILLAFPYMNTVTFAIYDDIIGPEEDKMEKNLEEFGGLEAS